jgi:hypothetical protein
LAEEIVLKLQIFVPAFVSILAFTSPMNQANAAETLTSVQNVVAGDLSISGIDEQVAKAAGNQVVIRNGYKVLIDGNTGREIARIRTNLSPGIIDPSPRNAVVGNCGTSYLYIQNLGGKKYQFSTGFDLTVGKSRDFSWQILVNSQWTYPNSGSYNFQWSDSGPMLLTTHWTSGWKVDQSTAPSGSLHVGRVLKGIVYRSDGVICTSGYPTASAYVY